MWIYTKCFLNSLLWSLTTATIMHKPTCTERSYIQYQWIGVSNQEKGQNAQSPTSLFTMALWGPFSYSFFLPFSLMVCCFVGHGCLMLKGDQITKGLFWSHSITWRTGNDMKSVDGKCFHRAWLFEYDPPLCTRTHFTLLDWATKSL